MNERRKKKEQWHPLDPKTGRLVFTPVLRSTGERLDLEVDYHLFPKSKAAGYHGTVQDLKSRKWYAVFGKECEIPGCNCDAWVEEVTTDSNCYGLAQNAGMMGVLKDAPSDLSTNSQHFQGFGRV